MTAPLWLLNNAEPALKTGGADYFSTGFISLAADPFGEAMSARVFIRLNDGAGGAPGTLLDLDGGNYRVIDLGRITRRREREYGVMQGQAWQVRVHNAKRGLMAYSLSDCWCCVEAGFAAADEWQVMAQGKIAGVSYGIDDSATIEVHDGVMHLLNAELSRDVVYDTFCQATEIQVESIGKNSRGYDNEAGGVTISGLGTALLTDETFIIEFTSTYQFKVILEDGDESQTGDILNDMTVDNSHGRNGYITIGKDGWSLISGSYAEGDRFVFYTSKPRQGVSSTPVQTIRKLISDFAGLAVYDVKNGAYYTTPFWDETTWALATAATSEPINSVDNTYQIFGTWQRGSNIMTMIQDALKLVNGSIFSTPTGQVGIWLLRPSAGATVAMNGQIGSGPIEILDASVYDTLEESYNQVTFEYLSSGGDDAVVQVADEDPSISQTRAATVKSGWRVRGEVAQSAANIFLNRFKDARRQYIVKSTLAGALLDVGLGVSINEPDLGLTAQATDVTEIVMDLLDHTVTIKAHTDKVALLSYARIGDAATDPVGSVVGSTDKVW